MITEYSGWLWVNRDPHRKIRPPDSQRLDQIKVPTLIVIGERDLLDFQVMALLLQQNIPNAHKVVLPGVGHMSNMEAPATFNQAVERFLHSLQE